VLRYPPKLYDAKLSNGKLTFNIRLSDPAQLDESNWTWTLGNSGAARNFAHIFIPTDTPSDVAIRIKRNGKPVPRISVVVGQGMHSLPLDGSSIPLERLLADPLTFDPAKLPLTFGIYCYFALDPENIADENLPPEMHEALKALGYIE
jgi:hypothetical protein